MKHQHGFTLVELSIVLVILGLLVGGVLAGQNLIRAAELRAITTEYTNFEVARQTFREKYFSLPGDMTNAEAFWGSATCTGTHAGTGTATCNGDGDAQVEEPAAHSQFGEMFTYFQHLSNAGLIDGSYTGIASTGDPTNGVAGTSMPESRLSGGAWSVAYSAAVAASSTALYEGSYGNYYSFGKDASAGAAEDAILSAEEAWGIDTKMDDAQPGTGIVRTRESEGNATAGSGCGDAAAGTGALAATVGYDLASTGEVCSLILSMK